jgi:uncharacterized membrane protein
MPAVFSFLFQLFAVAAGLVFAASLAVAFVLLLAAWGLRAAWARLTGRPVAPFVMRIDPLAGFGRVVRRGEPSSRTPRADAAGGRLRTADVTDVEPK